MNDISDKVLPSIVSYHNTKTTTKNNTSISDRLSAAKLINSFSSEAKLMRFSSDYIKYLSSASMTEPLVVRHALEKAIAETVNELKEKLSTDYIDSYKETDKMINNRVRLNQKVAIPTKIFDSWVDDKDFRERVETHKNNAIDQLYSALQESSDESQLLSESREILTQLTEQLAVLYETESIHVKSLGVIDSCNDNNVEKYMFISKIDDKTSKLCEGMNMAVFYVAEAKPMVNLPPLHPNCRSEIVPLQTVVKTPSPIFLASGFGQASNIQSLTTNGTLGNATSSSQSLAADTARSSASDGVQNPVMLDYALRQIGASVKELYYPFDESDVVVYYVRYNGKYYDVPVLTYVNGQPVVDMQMLASRLNLTSDKASKLSIGAGSIFNTIDEAAIAFQLTYGLNSKNNNIAAIIYRTADGKYSFTFGGYFSNGLNTSEIYTGEVKDRKGTAVAYVYSGGGTGIVNKSGLPVYYVEDKKLLSVSGKGVKEIADLSRFRWNEEDEGAGNVGYQDSTIYFLISIEGIWRTVVQSGDTYSIGYGMDFTKSSHPDLYQKYVVNGESITDDDAYKLLDPKLNSKIQLIIDELGKFITTNNLSLNQNQYDALLSYFYNNGAYVFSDAAYKSWAEKGGEHKLRAEARLELKNYLIRANGAYDSSIILSLFLKTKGPSIKYEYISRRTNEAKLFSK